MLLTSFILALRAVVVVKLKILDILFLISFILSLRVVVVAANLVTSDILSSISFILALHTFFLTISFLLHHVVYLN